MSNEIIKRGETAVSTAAINEQMDLLQHKFKLPPTMVETHKVRKNGDGTFTLVKRTCPIRIFDIDGKWQTSTAPDSYEADRVQLNKLRKRGKYGDAGKLMLSNDCVTVDCKEVVDNHFAL